MIELSPQASPATSGFRNTWARYERQAASPGNTVAIVRLITYPLAAERCSMVNSRAKVTTSDGVNGTAM